MTESEVAEAIVFDQFQRYDFMRHVVETISRDGSERILEVGAASSPLRRLLPDRITVLMDSTPEASGLDLRADGLHLPFPDRSFEFVACTDVLEHVARENRHPLLAELARVASRVLILGFPQNTAEAREADRVFHDLIRRTTGSDFPFLQEHQEFGLPDVQEVREQVQALFPHVLDFQNANIPIWMQMQISNYLALQHPELDDARDFLNRIMNERYHTNAHGAPCYRVFLVCSREAVPVSQLGLLRDWPSQNASETVDYASSALALAAWFEKGLNQSNEKVTELQQELQASQRERGELEKRLQHEMEKMHRILRQREFEIRELEVRSSLQESRITELTASNHNLQDYLNLFLNHPVYKVYKFLKTLWTRHKPAGYPSPQAQYEHYMREFEPAQSELEVQSTACKEWNDAPLLSIVTAVFEPGLAIFRETAESVSDQTYGSWEWVLADGSHDDQIWKYLTELSGHDKRIRPIRLPGNRGISGNLNIALAQVSGEYIVFLDHDDTLAPNALYEVAKTIRDNPDADFIYSDSDKLDEAGRRVNPIFKPDWSPEMMLCCNLLNQISVFRRSLLAEVGYLNPDLDGAQDWDLYLRIMEKTDRIYHIPGILYHWRETEHSTAKSSTNKPYAKSAQIKAITNHLQRTGRINPQVYFFAEHPIYQTHPVVEWETSSPSVCIIIPTIDQADALKRCITSVMKTDYYSFAIHLVDTGSTEKKTFDYYREVESESKISISYDREPFNFQRVCNRAARQSNSDLLLFLNNDTETLHPNWLKRMVQWLELPEVAVVGPKLLYQDGRIQHAGAVIGMGGLAAHLFLDAHENTSTVFGSDCWYRNMSAVSGACLLVRKNVFDATGGFDEEFELNYGDMDLCLRIRERGYRIVYTPHARLLHTESMTHQRQIPRSDFERFQAKWGKTLSAGDPYFNPNLSYRSSIPFIIADEKDLPENVQTWLMNRLPKKKRISLKTTDIRPYLLR